MMIDVALVSRLLVPTPVRVDPYAPPSGLRAYFMAQFGRNA